MKLLLVEPTGRTTLIGKGMTAIRDYATVVGGVCRVQALDTVTRLTFANDSYIDLDCICDALCSWVSRKGLWQDDFENGVNGL
jgi:hypothetical protein